MSTAPALHTGWRDRRDGTVIEVVEVRHWNQRIAASPPGGHGDLRVDGCPRDSFGRTTRRLNQTDFEAHFDLVWDPWSGFDAATATDEQREAPEGGTR